MKWILKLSSLFFFVCLLQASGSAGDTTNLWNPEGRTFYELIRQKRTAGVFSDSIAAEIKKHRRKIIESFIRFSKEGKLLTQTLLSDAQRRKVDVLVADNANYDDTEWDEVTAELAHLSTLWKVFKHEKILSMYDDLLEDMTERGFVPHAGDGIRWLVIFEGFLKEVEEGEELPSKNLKKKELKVLLQKYINSLDPKMTAFISSEIRRELFPSVTEAQEDAAQLSIDYKYARPYLKRALLCSTAILALGAGVYFFGPNAHDLAKKAFNPNPDPVLRGNEHINAQDGQKTADKLIDNQAADALPLLKR